MNLSAARHTKRSVGVEAGYAACGWGLAFAGVSFYWGIGGTLGLDTIGGSIERLALAHDRTLLIAVWVTGFLKILASLLALALAGQWAVGLARRPNYRIRLGCGRFSSSLWRRPGRPQSAGHDRCHQADASSRVEAATVAPLCLGFVLLGLGHPLRSGDLALLKEILIYCSKSCAQS